jgi:hypothetical protein
MAMVRKKQKITFHCINGIFFCFLGYFFVSTLDVLDFFHRLFGYFFVSILEVLGFFHFDISSIKPAILKYE